MNPKSVKLRYICLVVKVQRLHAGSEKAPIPDVVFQASIWIWGNMRVATGTPSKAIMLCIVTQGTTLEAET